MPNPTGTKVMKAGGKSYRLHLGMSVLADLQEQFGDTFDEVLSPPTDGRMPNLRVIHEVFMAALQRHHAGEADRWLVDDIIAENKDALAVLLTAAFPDADADADGAGEAAGAGKKTAAA